VDPTPRQTPQHDEPHEPEEMRPQPADLQDPTDEIDEESRERWEDESPASTLDRPGSGTRPGRVA
jgi:hypothetical protein